MRNTRSQNEFSNSYESAREHELNVKPRVLLGSLHQVHAMFENAGLQCTGICLEAFRYSLHKPATQWNSQDVDRILIQGNELYDKCVSGDPEMLRINQLPTLFVHGKTTYHLEVADNQTKIGYIMETISGNMQHIMVPLITAIQDTFLVSQFVFLIFRETTVALLRDDDKYFVFDSHARSRDGLFSEADGQSVVTMFSSIASLASFLKQLFISAHVEPFELFEATPVKINCIVSPETKKTKNCKERERYKKDKIFRINKLNQSKQRYRK